MKDPNKRCLSAEDVIAGVCGVPYATGDINTGTAACPIRGCSEVFPKGDPRLALIRGYYDGDVTYPEHFAKEHADAVNRDLDNTDVPDWFEV